MSIPESSGLIWIYPNTSELNRGGSRGGFSEREKHRLQAGFDLIEMPGDFVKNGSESERLGLGLCEPLLAREQVAEIYKCNTANGIRYSLHTEPSIPRTAKYQMRSQAGLNWCDRQWVETFATHVFNIVQFLQIRPEIIELHPGYRPNTLEGLARGISHFIELWCTRFDSIPKFLLENRTDQIVSGGADFKHFWSAIEELPTGVREHFGIIVDFQQLYTRSRRSFRDDLEQIPAEAVWEYHVHTKHSTPDLLDPIDWHAAFGLVKRTLKSRPVYMLPEVHHHNEVGPTAVFIRKMLDKAVSM